MDILKDLKEESKFQLKIIKKHFMFNDKEMEDLEKFIDETITGIIEKLNGDKHFVITKENIITYIYSLAFKSSNPLLTLKTIKEKIKFIFID